MIVLSSHFHQSSYCFNGVLDGAYWNFLTLNLSRPMPSTVSITTNKLEQRQAQFQFLLTEFLTHRFNRARRLALWSRLASLHTSLYPNTMTSSTTQIYQSNQTYKYFSLPDLWCKSYTIKHSKTSEFAKRCTKRRQTTSGFVKKYVPKHVLSIISKNSHAFSNCEKMS